MAKSRSRSTLVVVPVLLAAACQVGEPAVDDEVGGLGEGEVIYGADNRREYGEVGRRLQRLADSTAVLVKSETAIPEGDQFRLAGDTLGARLTDPSGSVQACPDERFVEQPVSGFCTAFAVGPDLLATAGHCVEAVPCPQFRAVFGFRMDGAGPRLTVSGEDVYSCVEVVAQKLVSEGDTSEDYAVFRVDRPLPAGAALPLRRDGAIADRTPLLVIGHPAGLPLKVTGGGQVKDSSREDVFLANLDTYGGNSGSPVFNRATGLVEGILVAGSQDFEVKTLADGSQCIGSNHCPDRTGCPGEESGPFEIITPITRLPQLPSPQP